MLCDPLSACEWAIFLNVPCGRMMCKASVDSQHGKQCICCLLRGLHLHNMACAIITWKRHMSSLRVTTCHVFHFYCAISRDDTWHNDMQLPSGSLCVMQSICWLMSRPHVQICYMSYDLSKDTSHDNVFNRPCVIFFLLCHMVKCAM